MKKSLLIALYVSVLPLIGQAQDETAEQSGDAQPEIEEVVVVGRFLSAAESLVV